MVLQDLGRKINSALTQLTAAQSVDEKILDSILKDICAALLESDVNVRLVQQLRKNVKEAVKIDDLSVGAALNRKRLLQKAVFDELVRLVDPGVEPWKPQKKRANVIMFVGLQGSGKTTSCTKLAAHYKRKGWKVALVGADTYRAGAYDQLKQNAVKVKIPFYGSYDQRDAAKLARDGVDKFKQEGFEIIIVDTSGRHKQEAELFDEMLQIESAVNPDNIIFVLDGTIGQAAELQAKAFHEAVSVGQIIITKMDGHAKGGGAISAVAATQSPIIFIGTGEHFHDMDPFNAKSFVQKMLGMGDVTGLIEKVTEMPASKDFMKQSMKNLQTGQFSLRDLQTQFQQIGQMGPLNKIMGMIPGFSEDMLPKGSDADTQQGMKRFLRILDSLTEQELDSDGKMLISQPGRIVRICRGAGVFPEELAQLLASHRQMADMYKKMGGMPGMKQMLSGAGQGGGPLGMGGGNPRNMQSMANQMKQMRNDPRMAQMMQQMQSQMGGMGGLGGGLQQMMQQMSRGGMPDLSALMGAFGGQDPFGGAGALPQSTSQSQSRQRQQRKKK
ncbi:hypothetical protein MIR68_008668 [Amoeboaphelidium protococcarum]|nr:hypothetical protein MIR68_008668 [Amoeboaphelidium protococcarum]